MLIRNLPKSELLKTFATYMKDIIESGTNFEGKHLIKIIKDIGWNKMTNKEIR